MLGVMAQRGMTMEDLKPKAAHALFEGIKPTVDTFDTTTAVYGKTFVFTGALDAMVRRWPIGALHPRQLRLDTL